MGLYVKQLLAGRDFGASDYFAAQMANFVYLIGDDEHQMITNPLRIMPCSIDSESFIINSKMPAALP